MFSKKEACARRVNSPVARVLPLSVLYEEARGRLQDVRQIAPEMREILVK